LQKVLGWGYFFDSHCINAKYYINNNLFGGGGDKKTGRFCTERAWLVHLWSVRCTQLQP